MTMKDIIKYPLTFGLWISIVFFSPILIMKLQHLAKTELGQFSRPSGQPSYSFKFINSNISTSPGASLLKPKQTNSSAEVTERGTNGQPAHFFVDQFFDIERPSLPNKKLKVYHFLHHSHTDAGWIQTMLYLYDQYVESILKTSLSYINWHDDFVSRFSFTNYDFVRMFLKKNPSNEMKEVIDKLLKNKKYEILNSAIAMPDQSVTYFEDLINNIEYGREYGLKTFGEISRHAWTIDNFGQSAFHTRLYAELGYDTLTTVRLPMKYKDKLRYTKNLNFIWENKYPEFDMLTHVFTDQYTAPSPGVNFVEFVNEKIISTHFNLLQKYMISSVRQDYCTTPIRKLML